jgi:hypothetical protein
MFCQTEREIALFDLLTQRFPDKHPQLLELIAWCGINRPERLQELFEQHKDDTESTLIDLADLDIKALCPSSAPTQITVDHDNL